MVFCRRSISKMVRSGIGAPELLKAHSISEIVALPGVGENYNGLHAFPGILLPLMPQSLLDHNLLFLPYSTTDDEITMDEIFHGNDADIKRVPMYSTQLFPSEQF